MNKQISIISVLSMIEEDFELIDQWVGMKSYDRANHYAKTAEALIELLEIFDCGSIGGFGNKKSTGISDNSLKGRYLWLYNKYNKGV